MSILRTTQCLEISVEVKEVNQSEVYTTEIASDKELSKLETKSLSFLYEDKNSLKNNVLDNLYELSIKESMKITREKNFVSF